MKYLLLFIVGVSAVYFLYPREASVSPRPQLAVPANRLVVPLPAKVRETEQMEIGGAPLAKPVPGGAARKRMAEMKKTRELLFPKGK